MHLAQLNIAKAKYSLEAPEIKEFVDNLEHVNNLAESSSGFIWRLKDEDGDATNIQAFSDPNTIVNMSVWDSVDALKNFMFRTHHRDFLRRKKEWFYNIPEDSYVLWWIPVGHIPTIEEAVEKLEYLRSNGDTPNAFSFKSNYSVAEYREYNA
jgi:heme-degrading monooxygenase HmoA